MFLVEVFILPGYSMETIAGDHEKSMVLVGAILVILGCPWSDELFDR